jgi:hypothetical protein
VQFFKQLCECHFLCGRPCVGGLTADVKAALIAYAYGVGVVVHTVSADHILRTARLDFSVTTDNVVIAYAEVETPPAVPGVDLRGRTGLVGPHCRTVYYNQCYCSHHFSLITQLTHDVAPSAVSTADRMLIIVCTTNFQTSFFFISFPLNY